ncbi:MAG: sugar phosphate isomerase/epimerase [Thermoleophilia bacterium]|nr:sugar phosphate isomerase/epimerase [Thermoleophilia bacterium]
MSNFKFGGQAAGLDGIIFLAGHGFDFADLNLNEIAKIRAEERHMLNAAGRAGMFFVAHAPDLRVDNEDGLERIREAVEYAAVFQPRTVTIHPIMAPGANSPEKIEKKIKEIAELAELASGIGASIACENTSEVPGDMRPVLDAHPQVMLTLDIGHSELLSDRNKSLDFIAAWPDRIAHVHIHDNVGGNTHHEDLHLPLGEGRIDFAPIMAALRELPQEVTVTFEMPRQKAYEGLLWLRERSLT